MNTDDTQAPAGRETDAAVARAMGYGTGIFHGELMLAPSSPPKVVPHYSADTPDGYAAMREVLAWLNGLAIEVTLEQCNGDFSWLAAKRDDAECFLAESLPLAVCRLALAVAKGEGKA